MCYLDDFVLMLESYLTGNTGSDSNIIKRHSRKLDTLGDLSFPSNVSNWKRILKDRSEKGEEDILNYANTKRTSASGEQALLIESGNWPFKISKCVRIKNHYHLHLDKEGAFSQGVQRVLSMGDAYGTSTVDIKHRVQLFYEAEIEKGSENTVSELRVQHLKSVIENLLKFLEYDGNGSQLTIEFSLKSNVAPTPSKKVVYCGPVLNDQGSKNSVTAQEYIEKRTIDMRLMAEHKYGVRATTQPGWKEIWQNLGEASVIIELLQNKPSHATVISLTNSSIGSVKGAPFIMYNGARLVKLIREFEKRVATNVYPTLPDLDKINFTLLNQPEEWDLFYVYILQFPQTVKLCICDIENGKISPHNIIRMLSNLVNVFSMYYRRVKILTEPRDHLFGTLHARIYLLRALSQVLFNSMRILNIKPVTQM